MVQSNDDKNNSISPTLVKDTSEHTTTGHLSRSSTMSACTCLSWCPGPLRPLVCDGSPSHLPRGGRPVLGTDVTMMYRRLARTENWVHRKKLCRNKTACNTHRKSSSQCSEDQKPPSSQRTKSKIVGAPDPAHATFSQTNQHVEIRSHKMDALSVDNLNSSRASCQQPRAKKHEDSRTRQGQFCWWNEPSMISQKKHGSAKQQQLTSQL